MNLLRKVVALTMLFPLFAYCQGNTFDRVRYNGGSISTTVKPDEWGNKLNVTSEAIVLTLKDGQSISILPKDVTTLSYGQEAHRNVGTAIGLAVFSLGIGALSALHKTKLHYIGVSYTDESGKKQGVLLQGDKGNFRAILVALQGVTGVPISVGDKDRNEIPAGVNTQTVKAEEPVKEAAKPAVANEPVNAAASAAASDVANITVAEADAMIALVSTPIGADVTIDDAFVGNSPAKLKLKAGKHTIKVTMAGYKDWSRDMTVMSGSEVNLTATLEKTN
jgi:hypothetical protein